ncbi:MAG: ABC transporter permease [Flavobacteriales bacterium]|nr:ABC transporter permease [Flavobacteriales bacterium]MBK6943452.1 ABC transporter permease [Flavobacteriales bacterium]MBK7240661.1 ABC transporter permease [Flavobacteriales bacterium]MBP9139091.1 ABC transporter permease [Flavobacteriales bacterium]HQV52107.1 ABC transporter permease [Flavobacteriales bacterium]
MTSRILAHIQKELLLLLRDRGGLALLYLMPVCLVSIMAVVQDAPFKDFSDKQVLVLYRDLDGGVVGKQLLEGLNDAGPFMVTDITGDAGTTDAIFQERVRTGEFQVGITVPSGVSEVLVKSSDAVVKGLFGQIAGDSITAAEPDSAFVEVLIDPVVKKAFRELMNAQVNRVLAGLSADRMLQDMTTQMENLTGNDLEPLRIQEPFIRVKQRMAGIELSGTHVAADSTQHNVPAWTIFAMFFSVVLMAGNMVKERDSGIMARMLTMPGGAAERIAGRVMAFLLVCVSQATLIFAIGVFLLPILGLPALDLQAINWLMLLLVTLAVGAAATSYGVLVGAFSTTQQQSAVFGSTSVVILSALGGIWVPLYIMPKAMRTVGELTPLNWSMEAYNAVLLRDGNMAELWPYLMPLLIFTAICTAVAIFAERITSRK